VKNRNWLDIAEYLMLFGSGVGSVASAASQQVLYSAAPLSFLMVLNLANRRRLQQRIEQDIPPAIAQLDQRIANEVEILNHKLELLPTDKALDTLKITLIQANQGIITQLTERVNHLRREIAAQTAPLKEYNLAALQDGIQGLQERNNKLEALFAQLHSDLRRQISPSRVEALEALFAQVSEDVFNLQVTVSEVQESLQDLEDEQKLINPRTLQDQIDHLNRRLSNLPQAFDASSLRKDVESLLSIVTDLVPRRELARLLADLEKIHQQQTSLEQAVTVVRLASTVFRKQLDSLSVKLNVKEEALNWLTGAVAFQSEPQVNEEVKSSLAKLAKGLATLQQQMKQLPPATDMATLHRAVEQAVAVQVGVIEQQLVDIRQVTQSLATEQGHLQSRLEYLPEVTAAPLWQQPIETFAVRLEQTTDELSRLQTQIEAKVEQRLEELSQQSVSDLVVQRLQSLSQQVALETVQQYLAEWGQQPIGETVLQQLQALSQQVAEETVQRRLAEWSQQSFTGLELQPPAEWSARSSQMVDVVDLSGIATIEDLVAETDMTQSGTNAFVMPDLATLMNEFEQVVAAQLDEVRQQVVNVQQTTQILEQEQNTLRSLVNQSATDTLEQQLNALATRVEWAESNLGVSQSQQQAPDRAVPDTLPVWVDRIPFATEEVPSPFAEEESPAASEFSHAEVAPEPELAAPSLFGEWSVLAPAIEVPLFEASAPMSEAVLVSEVSPGETFEVVSELPATAAETERSDEGAVPALEPALETSALFGEWSALDTVIEVPFPDATEFMSEAEPTPEVSSETVSEAEVELQPLVETSTTLFLEESTVVPERESESEREPQSEPELVSFGIDKATVVQQESELVESEQVSESEPDSEPERTLASERESLVFPDEDAFVSSQSSSEMTGNTLADFTEELAELENRFQATTAIAAEDLSDEVQFVTALADDVPDLEAVSSDAPVDINGRCVLEEALENSQERVIIVSPYPTPDTIDDALIQKFSEVLDRGVRIDIGWGHLADASRIRVPRCLYQPRLDSGIERGFLQSLLRQLAHLKKRHPQQFRFKILGTHENFVVCDRSFAGLGVHPMPIASHVFPQNLAGLKTDELEVIHSLITRFDDATPDPNNADIYFNRGTTRYDLGDKQGAIADYTQVLRLDSDDDVAFNNRGLSRYELGDQNGAIVDFNNALQINPENAIAYFNRAAARTDLGDKLGCISDFSQAIRHQPNFALAYFYRGMARMQVGNRVGAIEDYTEAIGLNDQDAMSHFYRGLAYFRSGDKVRAAADLKQAERLFTDQKDKVNRQRVLQALKELESALAEARNASTNKQTNLWPL
jgi:tetratricopeptide (TPR) repeat protein